MLLFLVTAKAWAKSSVLFFQFGNCNFVDIMKAAKTALRAVAAASLGRRESSAKSVAPLIAVGIGGG